MAAKKMKNDELVKLALDAAGVKVDDRISQEQKDAMHKWIKDNHKKDIPMNSLNQSLGKLRKGDSSTDGTSSKREAKYTLSQIRACQELKDSLGKEEAIQLLKAM